MSWDAGLDALIARMERAMDVASRRQQLTASNVANIDTPGYRTQDIDFDEALKRAVRQNEPATSAAKAGPVRGLPVRNDGNDVSADREMLALAQTRLRYETAAAVARLRLRQLRSALTEGRNG